MKILFEVPHNRLTGVNTFTYTVAKELAKKHEIVFFLTAREIESEILLNKLKTIGEVIDKLTFSEFDLFFLVNANTAELYKQLRVQKIFIGHGLHDLLYYPEEKYIDFFYYVSKFGVSQLSKKYTKEIKFIPNLIDTNRFAEIRPINKELKNVLLFDSRDGWKYSFLFERACSELNLNFRCLGVNTHPELLWNTEEIINEYDLVIGYGRTILESMSCGRQAICYGRNGGDGYINRNNFDIIASRNFSGFALESMLHPSKITTQSIKEELLKYDCDNLRDFVVNNYDVSLLLKYIKELA